MDVLKINDDDDDDDDYMIYQFLAAHRYCALITPDENLLQNRMQSCFQTSGRRWHNGPTSSWPMTEAA